MRSAGKMSQRRGPIWNPNIPLPVWDLWIGAAEVMVAGERIALPNERPPTEAAFYLNRFFGVAFAGRFAASEISVRTSCASFASLCSRRRAIFVRISSALFLDLYQDRRSLRQRKTLSVHFGGLPGRFVHVLIHPCSDPVFLSSSGVGIAIRLLAGSNVYDRLG